MPRLGPKVGNVYVNARMHVVQHVPPGVVRIFVHRKVITTIPAPVRASRPIPIRHLEVEAAWEPEAVVVAVDPLNVVAVGCAEMLKAPMLEGMVHMKTLVIGTVVPVPMVVAHVLCFVDFAAWVALYFRPSLRSFPMRGCWGNPPLVGSRRIITRL